MKVSKKQRRDDDDDDDDDDIHSRCVMTNSDLWTIDCRTAVQVYAAEYKTRQAPPSINRHPMTETLDEFMADRRHALLTGQCRTGSSNNDVKLVADMRHPTSCEYLDK